MPDLNGYTPIKVVNIGLPPATPDVSVSTADTFDDIWDALNGLTTGQRLSFAAGDYLSKGGPFVVTGLTGTQANPIWITLAGTAETYPWNTSEALLNGLRLVNCSWVFVYRLSSSGNGDPSSSGFEADGCTDCVFDKCHSKDAGGGILFINCTRVVGQYCYSHEHPLQGGGGESGGLLVGDSVDSGFTCCEVHDAHNVVQFWQSTFVDGCFIENTDVYVKEFRYDQDGTPNPSGLYGPEDLFEIKSGGTSSKPALALHNRIWGAPVTVREITGFDDTFLGSSMFLAGTESPPDGFRRAVWWRIQNNIFMDGVRGIASLFPSGTEPSARISIIGNLFKGILETGEIDDIGNGAAIFLNEKPGVEVYFNTKIGCTYCLETESGLSNLDVKGNVEILCGAAISTFESGSNIEKTHNAFYGTPTYGTNTLGNFSLPGWATSQVKAVGDMALIPGQGKIARCTTAGTTHASTEPTWPDLGQTVSDGTVVWQIIRVPYVFWRKLLTTPEQVSIPYARVHSSAPEATFVPSGVETGAVGSRTSIGVNNDVAPSGILATDLVGNSRAA